MSSLSPRLSDALDLLLERVRQLPVHWDRVAFYLLDEEAESLIESVILKQASFQVRNKCLMFPEGLSKGLAEYFPDQENVIRRLSSESQNAVAQFLYRSNGILFPPSLTICTTHQAGLYMAMVLLKDKASPNRQTHFPSITDSLLTQVFTQFVECHQLITQQHPSYSHLVTNDDNMIDTITSAAMVAPFSTPALIYGETGTGKDLLARLIHRRSRRRHKPMVKINCGAIPETLIDSELFGHEKGAFTGATHQRKGKFEQADQGTLFLDEVGELPPSAQVRLLRAIQNGEVERVGGNQTLKLDVRIIAATHRDLKAQCEQGLFRYDLYYRLNVFPITIPSLSDRKKDIPLLVRHFIEKKSAELQLAQTPSFTFQDMQALSSRPWPGNVRELENEVERLLIQKQYRQSASPRPSSPSSPPTLKLEDVMRRHICDVLELTGGRIQGEGAAAELLGMHPNTLRSKLQKLGIN